MIDIRKTRDDKQDLKFRCFIEYMRENFQNKGAGIGFLYSLDEKTGNGIIVYYVSGIYNYRILRDFQLMKDHHKLEPVVEIDRSEGSIRARNSFGQILVTFKGKLCQMIDLVPGREGNLMDLILVDEKTYLVSIDPTGTNSALYIYDKQESQFIERTFR